MEGTGQGGEQIEACKYPSRHSLRPVATEQGLTHSVCIVHNKKRDNLGGCDGRKRQATQALREGPCDTHR